MLSAALIALGLAVQLAAPAGPPPTSVQVALSSGFGRPTLDPRAFLGLLASGSPIGIIELGTLSLVSTPIVRVTVSVLLFLDERDTLYVGVTLLVLSLLLLAIFVVGPVMAGSSVLR